MEKKIITNNFTAGRTDINGQTHNIEFVVIHTYNGKGRSLYNWFNNPKAGASAHYAVFLDGEYEQYVEEWNTAWHAGDNVANCKSIGIEHQDNGNFADATRTNEMYDTTIELIIGIYKRYSLPKDDPYRIRPHNEFASTGCPGGLDINRIRAGVMQRLSPDKYYRIIKNNAQIAAFAEIDNAFNLWLDDKDQIVTFAHEDITSKFIDMANKLEKQILELMDEKKMLQGEVSKLDATLQKNEQVIKELEKEKDTFLKSFFGQLYLLFRKNEGKNN